MYIYVENAMLQHPLYTRYYAIEQQDTEIINCSHSTVIHA